MVARTAWAGPPPDGIMDSLMFWLPSVKSARRVWDRGQALWAEQMTAALSGPCTDCQGGHALSSPPPAATIMQSAEDMGVPPPPAPTAYMVEESATTAMSPGQSSRPPAYPDRGDAMTSAVPNYAEQDRDTGRQNPLPLGDVPTSAAPSLSQRPPVAREPAPPPLAPTPSSDEHESHTVILSSLPSMRTATRLVVLDGPVHGRQFSLGRDRTTIGRSIGCHVTVEADAVDYDHARVVRSGDRWQIELVGGGELRVNDEPVTGTRLLANGDVIAVGPARLRFESAS